MEVLRHVGPGDVVTAERWNQLVDAVRAVEERLAGLDAGGSGIELEEGSVAKEHLEDATRARLVSGGDDHTHLEGDGAPIRHGAIEHDDGHNPHGTTAADVAALPTAGGEMGGHIRLMRGSTAVGGLNNTFVNRGVQHVLGSHSDAHVGLYVTAGPRGGYSSPVRTALLVRPEILGYHALVVGGMDPNTDTLVVHGSTHFETPPQLGHIVETFVNASGTTLRPGDVVKLTERGVARFHGDDNATPIAEVTLADRADDTALIGVVAREATPIPGEPDRRADANDPTVVPAGGDVEVVVGGAFAHCKVDADRAPIVVGDFLVSCDNPGHATKATHPRPGTVLGKALEPLDGGTGYVSLHVNLQ